MTDDSILHRHALRLAILQSDAERAKTLYETAREAAAVDFAAARKRGITQQRVILGDGTELGVISLIGGGRDVQVDEGELMLHVALTEPGEIEDYVLGPALQDKRVLDLIAEHLPEFIGRRITPAHRKRLQKELEEHDGYVADHSSGEAVKVATITNLPATGKFRYLPADQAPIRISAALEAGTLDRDGQIIAAPAEPAEEPS